MYVNQLNNVKKAPSMSIVWHLHREMTSRTVTSSTFKMQFTKTALVNDLARSSDPKTDPYTIKAAGRKTDDARL